jgi:glycosyltransferase involved in cell wall biosynthesis
MCVTVDARLARTSGIGTYIQAVLPRVIARMPGARFTVLGDPTDLREIAPADTRVRHVALDAPIYSMREQLALARAIPAETSVLWAPHYNVPLLYRGPLAVMVHDVNHLVLPPSTRARRVYARTMFAAVGRRARVILCNSRFTEAEIARHVRPRAPVVVSRLGVSPRWLAVPPAAAQPRSPYLLYVGNVKPHKNLPRLLAAFARLTPVIAHRLVIVGRQEGFLAGDPTVTRMAGALGDRVRLTGRVPDEALEQWVRGCDALVLPSLYEGFGLPALEALACGRAVAAARAGALPEVCGPEAEYFDPLDVDSIVASLHRLATRPPDDAATEARRRAWAARFDWEECAAITAAALDRAAAGVRAPG